MTSEVSTQDTPPVLHPGNLTQFVPGTKSDLARQLLHDLEKRLLTVEEPARVAAHLGSFFQAQIIEFLAEQRTKWKRKREKVENAWQEIEKKCKQRLAELNAIQAKTELDYQSKLTQAEQEGHENVSKAQSDVNSWREPIDLLTKKTEGKLSLFEVELSEDEKASLAANPLSRETMKALIRSSENNLKETLAQFLSSRETKYQLLRDVFSFSGIIILAYISIFLIVHTNNAPLSILRVYGHAVVAVIVFVMYPWLKFQRRRRAKRTGEEFARIIATALSHCDYWLTKAKADHQAAIDRINQLFEAASARYQTDVEETNEGLRTADAIRQRNLNNIAENEREEQTRLSAQLMPVITHMQKRADRLSANLGWAGRVWKDQAWSNWQPATTTAKAIRIGQIVSPKPGLTLPPNVATQLVLPAVVNFGTRGLLMAPTHQGGRTDAIGAVQSLLFRQLAAIPPGKVLFVLIDPVDFGKNVAPVLGLTEHAEVLVTTKPWLEPQHIERQLAELLERIENITQKCLGTKYQNIDEYNAKEEVAEPYRVLVVIDFPVNFTETAAKRLVNIAQKGPPCGVHTIVVADRSKKAPHDFSWKDLEQNSTMFELNHVPAEKQDPASWVRDADLQTAHSGANQQNCGLEKWSWPEPPLDAWNFTFDDKPAAGLQEKIIEHIGELAKQGMQVKVPYEKLLEKAGLVGAPRWKESDSIRDKSTAQEILVPLGPGENKLQYLSFGQGMTHHALVVGRTGSGKSNLLHVLIITAALTYPPNELQFYLIDFKKGVEFKSYAEAKLPHARVIAVESEREFGLSVLSSLNREMEERGPRFRTAGVNDIAAYRIQKDGADREERKLPRLLLIVDEFQEFFTQDDRIAREASLLLDRLARQGRNFGIHIVLCTQTLTGSHGLARSTMEQMAVRIALQCSEADSRLILADDNSAARRLSRPGEGIYNDKAGLAEGNKIFQVARFNMEEDGKRYLSEIEQLSHGLMRTALIPTIFEGHEPAQIESCQPLTELLSNTDWQPAPEAAKAWLGESMELQPPNMLPPTEVVFGPQSGSHLLVVAREEAEGAGLLTAAVLSLAAQHHPDDASFYIANLTTSSDTEWVTEDMADLLPHSIGILRHQDLAPLLRELSQMVREQSEEKGGKNRKVYLVILGLQRARELRQNDDHWSGVGEPSDGTPSEHLADILRDGPDIGVHVLVWCDTYANVTRVLNRSVVRNFGIRVGTAMSSDDSMSLFDDPAASRLDRPYRAILYNEDRSGSVEKFRPYSRLKRAKRAWLEAAARSLRARIKRVSLAGSNT